MDILQDIGLFEDVKSLINATKSRLAVQVNCELTTLYWEIGHCINVNILSNDRADYGKSIVATLSRQLQNEFGEMGFSEKNLWRMMQFATLFPDKQIVVTLSRQLTWSHVVALLPITDNLKRKFYIEMCRIEHWSVRALRDKINGMLYERTAISRKPESTISAELAEMSHGKISPDLVFQDPYLLGLLGIKDSFSEKDLENAILSELQKFIIEIGSDFAFLARQKRITIDNEDYYIDLLFYHRRLKCLVAIDLKIGPFKAAYKGQMELYLRWLEKYETIEGENKPIGLILCAGKNDEHIELLHLDETNIRVAEYYTVLPERKELERKLQLSIERARNRVLTAQNN